jgi:hypothetical protein
VNNDWDSYGKIYSKGDVVGCGIDWGNSQFFFTLNGKQLGESFCTVTCLSCTKVVLRNDKSYSAATDLSAGGIPWKERDSHLGKFCRTV